MILSESTRPAVCAVCDLVVFAVELRPENMALEHLPIKGDEGIEIAPARHCFVCDQHDKNENQSNAVAPDVKRPGHDQQKDAHELERVAELKTGL